MMHGRGFGTLAGGTTNDRLVSTFVNDSTLRSVSAWLWIHPDWTSANHRVFAFGDLSQEMLSRRSYDNRLTYLRGWSTTDGQWGITFNETLYPYWIHVGVTSDNSSTSNNAQFYINGKAVTTTRTATPAGSLTTISSAMIIGNQSSYADEWMGWLGEIALWDTILDPADMLALACRRHPRKVRRDHLVMFADVAKGTVNDQQCTIVGTRPNGGPF